MANTIVVFGVGKGLSLAVAKKYAAEGYNVALVARNKDNLDNYLHQLQGSKGTIKGYLADLLNVDQLNTAIANILADFGHIDIAFSSPTPATNSIVPANVLTVYGAQTFINLIYFSAINIVQKVLPVMIERKQVSTREYEITLFVGVSLLRRKDIITGNRGGDDTVLQSQTNLFEY
jgi:NAD(P)-dependent dehydrogenase (short-subunit alcohol dehydrogenase family)